MASGWTRVSSFKPPLVGFLVTAIISSCLVVSFDDQNSSLPLIATGTVVALGLIALNCKVVQKRGSEYRISTLPTPKSFRLASA